MTESGEGSSDEQRQHEFEVLASGTAYTGRVFALRVDEVTMPGGGSAVREIIEHPGAVAVAAIDDEDRIVLLYQYRHAVRRRLWELPAGLLDVRGEDPVATAGRELAEEAGLAATEWSVLVDVVVSAGFTDESVRTYLARGLSAAARPEVPDDEEADLTVHRVPLANAVGMVLTGEIVNASAVAGVLAAHTVVTGAGRPRPLRAPWRDRPHAWADRTRGS